MATQDFHAPHGGFATPEQQRQAQALVDACAEFSGAGDALKGLLATTFHRPQPIIEGSRIIIPTSMLSDIAKGPAGRLGMALLRASSTHGAPPSKIAAPPRATAPSWSPGDEDASTPTAAWRPREQAKPKPLIDEGSDEDSLGYMVQKLEDQGFGGTSSAIIAANKAKRQRSGRR